VAAIVETETAAQGEWVWLTLYWQQEAVADEAPIFVLELFGQNETLLGKTQSYHGSGLLPAMLWPQNQIVVDRVAVRVDTAPDVPVQGRLNMKLEGEMSSVDAGFVKILPNAWPEAAGPPLAEVGGVGLTSVNVSQTAVSPGQTILVTVQWQVIEPPGQNLTTFVHLGDQTNPPLAQGDSPPLNGSYPIQLWATGEVLNDSYQLTIPGDLPDGRYPLYLGFYAPDSGERPLVIIDGTAQPNNAYFVGWLDVN
jgi:hypothetical protein